MNPRQFLQIGGAILLILGIVGYLGIFTRENTPWFWLDQGENVAHIVLGIVALAAGFLLRDPMLQRWLVIIVGVVGVLAGLYGFLVAGQPEPNVAGVSNLENPSDNLLHLVVGAWALFAAFRPTAMTEPRVT
jgi:hypothetical protein